MIRFYPDSELLSREAAELFVDNAEQSIRERGRFRVALSGGSTPRAMYKVLAEAEMQARVEWEKVHVFWGDERCVPPDHRESNERLAKRYLLGNVPIPTSQIYPIRCEGDAEEAAQCYASILSKEFGDDGATFDLIYLGLGKDGHTASLFPYSPQLEERTQWAVDTEGPGGDIRRVSLTFPVINRSLRIVFLVTGAEKAPILKEVLEGPENPRHLPAQLVIPSNGDLIWMVDEAAGHLLGG